MILSIPESYYENTYHNVIVEMCVDKDAFSFYYFKQYPRFHKVKFKGKEISLSFLKSFFKKGYVLEIVDFLVSADSDLVVFDCVLFPYSSQTGGYEKVVLEIDCKYECLVFKDINAEVDLV